MFYSVFFTPLVFFFIVLFCLLILYTAFLVKKYSFLNDNKQIIIQGYTEFYEKYESDSYFSKRDLYNWIGKNGHFKNTIDEYRFHIEKLESYRDKTRYLKPLLGDYVNVFLLPREYEKIIEYLYKLFNNGAQIITTRNQIYIEKELNRYNDFFDKHTRNSLTTQQRRTIITDEANNLVVAGAETEKTPIMTGKICYILEKDFAKPEEILILAYTDKTKQELIERMSAHHNLEIEVHTFQSFGKEVIEQASGRLPLLHITAQDDSILQETMEDFLRKHLKDLNFANKVNQYFIYCPKPVKNKPDLTFEEYETYIKKLNLQSLKGERVKNMAELSIANFFYINNVEYQYEYPYTFETSHGEQQLYTPDFFLPGHNIWIEHIDIDQNCNTAPGIDRDEYLDSWYWKRKIHKENYTELLETYSYEYTEGTLIDILRERLTIRGVRLEPIQEEKIFNRLKDLGDISTFIELLIQFLRVYKSNTFNLDNIEERGRNHPLNKQYLTFHEIFEIIYQDYETMLRDSECIDFDDMINNAITHIEESEYKSNFKYILVDEFQDISQSRYRLIKSLIDRNPLAKTFCIGNDLRSVHGFPGSDHSLMTNFQKYFYPSEMMILDEV